MDDKQKKNLFIISKNYLIFLSFCNPLITLNMFPNTTKYYNKKYLCKESKRLQLLTHYKPMLLIKNTINFVKKQLEDAEGGHDWFHIERVYKNALLIAEEEDCDITIVKLGALLHDIADSKFHDGDEKIGPKTARFFLESQNVSEDIISHVIAIIENISFNVRNEFHTHRNKSDNCPTSSKSHPGNHSSNY